MIKPVLAIVAASLMLVACSQNPNESDGAASQNSGDIAKVDGSKTVATDALSGDTVFKRCVACHTNNKDGKNGIGPNLFGVVGRKIGSAEGFTYSNAMKARGGDWDEISLDGFLASPAKWLPGNKMAFSGIRSQEDRAALIDYLNELK